jgi:putative ABC transport system permease protein
MDTFLRDVKYGLRNLLKRPGFTAIAVLTIALGVGANSTIFSIVNALLLKPLPFPDPERVVALWDRVPSRGVDRNEVAAANYFDWRAQNKSFEHLGLYRWWSANLSGNETPERVQGFQVTTNFLDIVNVKPILGRGFAPDENEPGKDMVALLTYTLWQRRYGGEPDIVNKTIVTNGTTRTVIGVMPPKFNYPKGAEIYSPIRFTAEFKENRSFHNLLGIARLKPGVTIPAAQADLDMVSAQLEKQYPEANTGRSVGVFPILADTVRIYATALWVMMAAVGFVLLIGCANVANLMLGRALGRQKEIAVRAALGASRFRIIRQLLTESVILGLLGGALGILVAYWGIDAFRVSNPGDAARFAPGFDNMGIDLSVLVFTVAISILSGVLFGLAPAWQLSKPDLNNALKEGGRQTSSGSNRLRSLLVVSEIALSLMLLVSAGLLIRSFLQLLKTDPGFNPENLITMNLVLPGAKYTDDAARRTFYEDLLKRVAAVPGVQSASIVNFLPLAGANASNSFLVEGLPEPAPGQENEGRYRVCSPGYFQTMGISLLKGRTFTDQDKAGAPRVIIINETLARTYWPNQDPLGKRMRYTGPLDQNPWMTVVGVVQDVKHDLNIPVTSDYYVPHAQDPWQSMVLVAKTSIEPAAMAAPIRQQVWAIDRDQPVFDVKTMREVRAGSITLYSFSSVMLSIFAGIALLLSAVGIYGVMAFAVTQRTHEFGIRMALGASGRDVLKLVVRNGMLLAVTGVGLGLAGAWGLTRFLSSMLVGVSAMDLLTLSAVSGGLLLVALLACYIPARRATKVDPLVALRYE